MAQKKATPRSNPPGQRDSADTPLVRLHVDGGNRDERYDFHFEASQAGAVRFRMSCEMSGRRVTETESRMEPAQVEGLVRALSVAKLKQVAARQARTNGKPIPPCSLIGTLEVWDGRTMVRVIFMADPEQAKQAGHPVPADVKKAVDTIYGMAARQMGLEGAAAVCP